MISETRKGYLHVAVAAVMWASSGTIGKSLFDSGVTPSDLVQIRVTLASLIILSVLLIFRPRLLILQAGDVGYLVLLGGVMALVQITYFFTISRIQVVAAILLQYLSPIIVAVFSMLFWKEKASSAKVTALIIAVVGCYLVVGGYNLQLLNMNRLGILGGFAAAVSYAAYALLGEKAMHKYRPWTVVFYSLFFAAIFWQLVHPPFKFLWASYSPAQWTAIMYIVIVGTIIPFGFYFVGINYVRSTRALILATLEPISAGIMAFFILGEKLELLQIAGAVLVVSAIVLLQLQKDQDSLTPELIRKSRQER